MSTNKRYITWADVLERVEEITLQVKQNDPNPVFYGIPRGGIIPSILASKFHNCSWTDNPEKATFIIDDLYDSGSTFRKWLKKYPLKKFCFLFDKRTEYERDWLVFPWEKDDLMSIEDALIRILQYKGQEITPSNIEAIKMIL